MAALNKRILLVDDELPIRKLVTRYLTAAGYAVCAAVDGLDGIAKLRGGLPDLIISDVNMPRMDGITFVKEAKKLPAYKFTPIIMLTTESEEKKKLEGQQAGAKAWVVKPFQPAQMLAAVSKLILP